MAGWSPYRSGETQGSPDPAPCASDVPWGHLGLRLVRNETGLPDDAVVLRASPLLAHLCGEDLSTLPGTRLSQVGAASEHGHRPWRELVGHAAATLAGGMPARFACRGAAGEESYDLFAYPVGDDEVALFIAVAARPPAQCSHGTDSDRPHRRLLEGFCDGVLEWSANGRTTYVSRRLAGMLGYVPDDMLGRHVRDFMEGAGESTPPASAADLADAGPTITHVLSRSDGSRLFARVQVVPLGAEDGGHVGAVTALGEAEAAPARPGLDPGAQCDRGPWETLPDAAFLVDGGSGCSPEAIRAGVRMFGYTRDELLTARDADASAQQGGPPRAALAGASSDPARLHRAGDGGILPAETAEGPFTWQEQALPVSSHRDVGGRLNTQQSLSGALAEPERRRAEAEELLAGARDLLGEEDFDTGARALCARCRDLLGAAVGHVSLRDAYGERYLAPGLEAGQGGPGSGAAPAYHQVAIDGAYESGEPVWHNVGGMGPLSEGQRSLENVLFAPLMVRGEAVGLLGFADKPGGFTDRDARLAAAFAGLLAVALSSSRTRDAIRESEKRLRAYVTNAPYALLVLDDRGVCVDVNPAACRLTGCSAEGLLAQPLASVAAPECADALDRLMASLNEAGHAEGVLRIRRGDGTAPWVALAAVRLPGGGYLVFGSDISDQRRAEEALRDSEEMLRSTMEQSLEGIVITDATGAVAMWNKAQAEITGMRREDVIGRPLWEAQFGAAVPEMRRPELITAVRDGVLEALRTGELPRAWATTSERAIFGPGGERRVMRSTVFPIHTSRGYLLGSISRDVTEAVRTEQALRESEAKFHKAFHDSPAAMAISTLAGGRFIDANQTFLSFLGYAPEEVVGKSAVDLKLFVLPEQRDELLRLFSQQGYIRSHEILTHTKGMSIREGLLSAVPMTVLDEPCWLTTVIDVTEQRIAERALRESEAKFAMAFRDNSSMMVISTIADGRFIEVNRAFLENLGYSRDDVHGRTSADIGLFVVREQRDRLLQVLREKGAVRNEDIQIYTKDRRVREGLFSAIPMVVGGQECWLSIVVDITEQRQAERALRRRATQLERLLQTAQQLSASLDRGHVLSLVAGQARELLEADRCTLYLLDAGGLMLNPVAAIGSQPWGASATEAESVDSGITGRAVLERRALVANGQPTVGSQGAEVPAGMGTERTMVAPFIGDGGIVGAIRVDRSGAPFDDDDLTLTQTFAAYAAAALKNAQAHERLQQEMRERQQAEARLLQSQKMESVGRLAGGVAHDFNNILTAITGFAEFVLDGLEPGASAREDMIEVLRSAERATHLTRQLLAFSRRQTMEMRPVDLNALVSDVSRLLRRLIGEDVELAFLPEEGLAPVMADSAQLEQVLMNLAVNARDAMPGGGRLTVTTRSMLASPALRPPGFALPDGTYVCLEVTDTGTGITREAMEHLFEPFYTTKEHGKGTGLGLATVYGIVQQHGGDIRVHSEPGVGSSFTVYLPALHGDSPLAAASEGLDRAVHRGETILLVEDEAVVRSVARRCLERLGYSVVEAGDGVEAIELLARAGASPSLLITDLVMPRMGGLELARRLRAEHPGLRVLYTSGYTDDARSLTNATEGGDVYLQKPFDARSLALKVSEALARG